MIFKTTITGYTGDMFHGTGEYVINTNRTSKYTAEGATSKILYVYRQRDRRSKSMEAFCSSTVADITAAMDKPLSSNVMTLATFPNEDLTKTPVTKYIRYDDFVYAKAYSKNSAYSMITYLWRGDVIREVVNSTLDELIAEAEATTTTTTTTLGPGTITMTMDAADGFGFWLRGDGQTVNVDWGDGSDEDVVLSDGYNEVTHSYATTNNTIVVTGAEYVTEFWDYDWLASGNSTIVIDAGCVSLKRIDLNYYYDSYINGTFVTHPEWVNLEEFRIDAENWTGIEDIVTHAEWVKLKSLYLAGDDKVTFVSTHPEWTALTTLDYIRTDSTSITTYPWATLEQFQISQNDSLTSVNTHAEWVNMISFNVYANPLMTTLTTHPEWVSLGTFKVSSSGITSIEAHSEWSIINFFDADVCAITSATVINAILVALDTGTGMGAGDRVDLSGGTNAAPTGAGATAVTSLQGKGVTVTTN